MISYRYKIYSSKKNKYLGLAIEEAAHIWNHALALQKRYYKMFHKYIPKFTLSKHIGKRWHRQYLNSQSLQEIVERLDKAYRRFFDHKSKRAPKFKKAKFFTSFVMKQCGYKFNGNAVTITLGKEHRTFRFHKSHNFTGNVKTVTIKRDSIGDYYLVIATDGCAERRVKSHNGASTGIDFGLKTYLTLSDGSRIDNPQFLKKSLNEIKKASRKLSKAQRGSHNRERARLAYARAQKRIADRRADFQWKLAHDLCRRYDYIFTETLNMDAMRRLWGRKVSDLSHSSFMEILKQVADKYGCTVHCIDKWYASSQMCECGYKNESLTLRERKWTCPECGKVHDRDINAARNILRKGVSELESIGKSVAAQPHGGYVSI